jgi:pimeloyl-ACP methyl ester carboxylesterase
MPETHHVTVADGEALTAVHHGAASDDWLVFCHGFLSDRTGSYEVRCERAAEEGYNAVRFDFRGCGDADGTFAASTLGARIADLEAVVEHFSPASYALFGSSFGGKVALHTAAEDDRVTAVATRAPVTYNRTFDEARAAVDSDGHLEYDDGRTIDRRFFESLDRYPFEAVTDALSVPVAVFHGTGDESVPLADSLEATGALGTDVFLQTFHGEGHRFSRAAEMRLQRWLFEWLGTV